LSTELTIRVTRMIPPIAKFKLVHESYSLDGDSNNTGVMIDVSWKEHDFRVPMCWMMRLETNAYKKFMRFFEDKNTSEEMREIISKLRVQFDAKVAFSLFSVPRFIGLFQEREKTKSKLKFMKYLLQNQSAFSMKKVVRQGNGNFVMTVKVIDQTGTHRQLVAILKETKVAMLNESKKKGKGSILIPTYFCVKETLNFSKNLEPKKISTVC